MHPTRTLALAALALPVAASRARAQGTLYAWRPASSVASAGEVDGDGVADFALGEVGDPARAGSVRFVSGASGATIRRVEGGARGDGFGEALARLGDLDGDGRDELAVSADSRVDSSGFLRLVSGATGATIWQIAAAPSPRAFGASLARTEDLDGDGVPDLVVGSPSLDLGTAGRASVYSGASGALLFDLVVAGASPGFGRTVDAGADLDGDGKVELLVGDPGDSASPFGRVTAHSGADGSLLSIFDAPPGCFRFGASLASIGDQDGDGRRDLVVGAPADFGQPGAGRVVLLASITGQVLATLTAESDLVQFGLRVGSFQDLDGDGREEVRVQADSHQVGCCGHTPAELRVLSGRTGVELYRGEGHTAPVAGVPDANGDGFDDYLLAGFDGAARLVLLNQVPPFPWFGCDAGASSLGCEPYLESSGAPSLTLGPDLRVAAHRVVPNTLCFLGWSTGYQYAPFGDGTLCLLAPIRRSGALHASSGESPCPGSMQPTGSFSFVFAKRELAALGLAPGSWFFVQGWFRDPGTAPPDDVGLTDALAVTLWP